MPKFQKSTWLTKEAAEAQRGWYVVDPAGDKIDSDAPAPAPAAPAGGTSGY